MRFYFLELELFHREIIRESVSCDMRRYLLIADSVVCDLGSGCGVLSIGAVIAGARYVVGFEVDQDAIDSALENREEVLHEDSVSTLEFIRTEVKPECWEEDTTGHRFQDLFDVVN